MSELQRRLAAFAGRFGPGPPLGGVTGTSRVPLAIAGSVLLVGAVLAWLGLPEREGPLRLEFVFGVALVLVPVTLGLNAIRFFASARFVGRRVDARTALRVSLTASAANLLPLPGSALVRVQGLRELGETTSRALFTGGFVALLQVAIPALAVAVLLRGTPGSILGPVLGAIGGLSLVAAVGVMSWLRPERPAVDAARLAAVECATVVVAASRIHLLLHALGESSEWYQAFALTLAAVAASAVGMLPDGLGLREAIAAGLAPVVGLAPALGFLVTAFDRVVALAVLAPVVFLLIGPRRG